METTFEDYEAIASARLNGLAVLHSRRGSTRCRDRH